MTIKRVARLHAKGGNYAVAMVVAVALDFVYGWRKQNSFTSQVLKSSIVIMFERYDEAKK